MFNDIQQIAEEEAQRCIAVHVESKTASPYGFCYCSKNFSFLYGDADNLLNKKLHLFKRNTLPQIPEMLSATLFETLSDSCFFCS